MWIEISQGFSALVTPEATKLPGNMTPTSQDLDEMWRDVRFEPTNAELPRTAEYMGQLRSRYSGGGAVHHSFVIDAPPLLKWHLQFARLSQCNFFERFWTTSGAQRVIPFQPFKLNYSDASLFPLISPFLVGGVLSQMLFEGGACREPSPITARDAKCCGDAAADELLGGDYEDSLCYHCESAWSLFFSGQIWDHTVLVISPSRRLIHTILVTDTD